MADCLAWIFSSLDHSPLLQTAHPLNATTTFLIIKPKNSVTIACIYSRQTCVINMIKGENAMELNVLEGVPAQQTRDIDLFLFHCWSTVYDTGPPLNQKWFNVSCLLGGNNDLQWSTMSTEGVNATTQSICPILRWRKIFALGRAGLGWVGLGWVGLPTQLTYLSQI